MLLLLLLLLLRELSRHGLSLDCLKRLGHIYVLILTKSFLLLLLFLLFCLFFQTGSRFFFFFFFLSFFSFFFFSNTQITRRQNREKARKKCRVLSCYCTTSKDAIKRQTPVPHSRANKNDSTTESYNNNYSLAARPPKKHTHGLSQQQQKACGEAARSCNNHNSSGRW